MPATRAIQVVATATALAGCVLFFLNLHTSESAWRRANPSDTQGGIVNIPEKEPARDASGPRGWSWKDGTPGWRPGERIQGYPIAGARARELLRARASASRAGVDGTGLRVVAAMRATRLLAILAAPAAADPAQTCLAAMLARNASVKWVCPGRGGQGRDLADSPALIAAASFDSPGAPGKEKNKHPLYLVGVARGDVRRVVLSAPGFDSERIYERGHTWGQFDAAWIVVDRSASLSVYGPSGLLEVVRLSVGPGQTQVFH